MAKDYEQLRATLKTDAERLRVIADFLDELTIGNQHARLLDQEAQLHLFTGLTLEAQAVRGEIHGS